MLRVGVRKQVRSLKSRTTTPFIRKIVGITRSVNANATHARPSSVAATTMTTRNYAASNRNFAGSPRLLNDERPVSPHVSIYRFALPAITSITHRTFSFKFSVVN